MRIVVFGLTIRSSWGNGHATEYLVERMLLGEAAAGDGATGARVALGWPAGRPLAAPAGEEGEPTPP